MNLSSNIKKMFSSLLDFTTFVSFTIFYFFKFSNIVIILFCSPGDDRYVVSVDQKNQGGQYLAGTL